MAMEYAVVAREQQQGVPQPQPLALAVADHRPPPVSQRTRGSRVMQQQRRAALEQEVAELRQQLCNEEAVHQVLDRALQQPQPQAPLPIPAFVPSKARELLAELVLVEEEIARLEAQIQAMKQHPRPPPPAAAAAAEIKSMFFITQAMDGDYLKRHSSMPMPMPTQMPTPLTAAADHHHHHSPRNSSSRRANAAASPKQKSSKILGDELPISRSKSMQPNRLSEKILKCLVCIFIRLLRSSRDPDTNSRSSVLQPQGSFRMDASLTVKDSSRDYCRGQQDHYGILAIPDAIVRDIGPYKNLVRFTSAALDLRAFSTSPLLTKLRHMLEALQHLDLRFLHHHQKLAFWINIYNTCIMNGILQHGLPSNPEKLLALKNKATINVSGQKFNALVIENFILRQPSSVKQEFWKCDVQVEEQEVRELYGLKSSEPNILFALCCGIRSSPALRIYKADRVVAELDKAKLEYLQASLVVTTTRRLVIPGLVHSNMHDFAKDMDSLLRWICEQLPTSWSLRKSMVDCLRARGGGGMPPQDLLLDVLPLDYEFQYLLPM